MTSFCFDLPSYTTNDTFEGGLDLLTPDLSLFGPESQFFNQPKVPMPAVDEPATLSLSDISSPNSEATLYAKTYSPESTSVAFDDAKSVKKSGRRRKGEEVELTDELAAKRQKQNAAAKRCREKREKALSEATDRAELAEKEKFRLSLRVAVLEKEKEAWLAREQELLRKLQFLQGQVSL
ncbi:hypothetical protein HDU91_007283 [Kappamyces sp. JEL0680]|nr:hypothetical protein HDU91_007283 [Kappamyces sp. JEL0680]